MVLAILANSALSATIVSLQTVNPGTETVTLVPNGSFESPNSATAFPTGWTRLGDAFCATPINGYAADGSWAAIANIDAGAPNGGYEQNVTVTAGQTYVLSGYLWNFGDATHHALVNLDLGDIPGEAQLSIAWNTLPNVVNGVFAYESFVAPAGGQVTVRAFYDAPVGGTTGWPVQPNVGQWDNIAITPIGTFVAPVPEPATFAMAVIGAAGGACLILRRHRQL